METRAGTKNRFPIQGLSLMVFQCPHSLIPSPPFLLYTYHYYHHHQVQGLSCQSHQELAFHFNHHILHRAGRVAVGRREMGRRSICPASTTYSPGGSWALPDSLKLLLHSRLLCHFLSKTFADLQVRSGQVIQAPKLHFLCLQVLSQFEFCTPIDAISWTSTPGALRTGTLFVFTHCCVPKV